MIGHIKSNTIGDFTGTVTVFNSQGSTQTANATDLVRPVDWNSAHTFSFGLGGNTSNASTFGGTDVRFDGSRNITVAGNASVLSIIGPDLAPYLTSQSNQAFSAGGGASNFQTLSFGDANGITWSNVGGAIQASYSQSTHSHATPAFSGSNGSFTANTLTFGSSNNIHFYTTNGSMVASYNDVDPVPAFSGSNGSFAAATLSFGNLNGLSFYTSNGSIVGSYTDAGGAGAGFSAGMSNLGNTAGTSGVVASQLVFVGSGEIGISQSVNGNSATITIYEPPSYGSFAENITIGNSSNFQRPTGVTFNIAPLVLDRDLSFDWVGNMRSASIGSTTFTGTTNNTTFSFQQAETHNIVIYSKNTGANSLSLGSVMSTTAGLTHSLQIGLGAQTTQYTISQGLTYPIAGGTSTYSTTYGVSNASLNISTTHLTAFNGVFMGLSSFGNTLPAGQYWVAFNQSIATTTQHTANMTNAGISISYGGAAIANATVRSQMGIASNVVSHGLYPFNGSATLAGGTAVSSVSMGQITQFASNVMIHARLGRFV